MLYPASILLMTLFCISYADKISDKRLCADRSCETIISTAKSLARHKTMDPAFLAFSRGDIVTVLSKSAGSRPDLWGGEFGGKKGYFPRSFVREIKVEVPNPPYTVETEQHVSLEDRIMGRVPAPPPRSEPPVPESPPPPQTQDDARKEVEVDASSELDDTELADETEISDDEPDSEESVDQWISNGTATDIKENIQSQSTDEQINPEPKTTDNKIDTEPHASDKQINTEPEATDKHIDIEPLVTDKEIKSERQSPDKEIKTEPRATDKQIDTEPQATDTLINTKLQVSDNEIKTEPHATDSEIKTEPQATDKDINTEPQANVKEMKTDPPANVKEIKTDPQTTDKQINTEPHANVKEIKTEPQIADEQIRTGPHATDSEIKTEPHATDKDINTESLATDKDINTETQATDGQRNTKQPATDKDIKAEPQATDEQIKTEPHATDKEIKTESPAVDTQINAEPEATDDQINTEPQLGSEEIAPTDTLLPNDKPQKTVAGEEADIDLIAGGDQDETPDSTDETDIEDDDTEVNEEGQVDVVESLSDNDPSETTGATAAGTNIDKLEVGAEPLDTRTDTGTDASTDTDSVEGGQDVQEDKQTEGGSLFGSMFADDIKSELDKDNTAGHKTTESLYEPNVDAAEAVKNTIIKPFIGKDSEVKTDAELKPDATEISDESKSITNTEDGPTKNDTASDKTSVTNDTSVFDNNTSNDIVSQEEIADMKSNLKFIGENENGVEGDSVKTDPIDNDTKLLVEEVDPVDEKVVLDKDTEGLGTKSEINVVTMNIDSGIDDSIIEQEIEELLHAVENLDKVHNIKAGEDSEVNHFEENATLGTDVNTREQRDITSDMLNTSAQVFSVYETTTGTINDNTPVYDFTTTTTESSSISHLVVEGTTFPVDYFGDAYPPESEIVYDVPEKMSMSVPVSPPVLSTQIAQSPVVHTPEIKSPSEGMTRVFRGTVDESTETTEAFTQHSTEQIQPTSVGSTFATDEGAKSEAHDPHVENEDAKQDIQDYHEHSTHSPELSTGGSEYASEPMQSRKVPDNTMGDNIHVAGVDMTTSVSHPVTEQASNSYNHKFEEKLTLTPMLTQVDESANINPSNTVLQENHGTILKSAGVYDIKTQSEKSVQILGTSVHVITPSFDVTSVTADIQNILEETAVIENNLVGSDTVQDQVPPLVDKDFYDTGYFLSRKALSSGNIGSTFTADAGAQSEARDPIVENEDTKQDHRDHHQDYHHSPELSTGGSEHYIAEPVRPTKVPDNNMFDNIHVAGVTAISMVEQKLKALIDMLPHSMQSALEQEALGLSPTFTVLITLMSIVTVVTASIASCLCKGEKKASRQQEPLAVIRGLEEKLFIATKEKENIEDDLQIQNDKMVEMQQELCNTQSTAGHVETDLQTYMLHNEAMKQQVAALQQQSIDYEHEVVEKSRELQANHEQIAQDEKDIEDLEDRAADLDQTLTKVKRRLGDSEGEVGTLQTRVQSLTDNIQHLETRKQQLEDEAIDWSEKVKELGDQASQVTEENRRMQEDLAFKENEMEVLRDCFLQLKTFEDNEIMKEEITDTSGSHLGDKLHSMMDVSRVNAMLKSVEEERDVLQNKFQIETESRQDLEGQIEKIMRRLESVQTDRMKAERQCGEAQTKLEVLSKYFKEKETELTRQLGEQEVLKNQNMTALQSSDTLTRQMLEENESYRQQITDLKTEITKAERDFRSQIASNEKKAHENWIATRAAERELKESRHECGMLRQKLTDLERKLMQGPPGLIRPITTRGIPPPGMMNGPPPPPGPPPMDRPHSRGSVHGHVTPRLREDDYRGPVMSPDRRLPPGPPPPGVRMPIDGRSPPTYGGMIPPPPGHPDRDRDRRSPPPPPFDRFPAPRGPRPPFPPPPHMGMPPRGPPPPHLFSPPLGTPDHDNGDMPGQVISPYNRPPQRDSGHPQSRHQSQV